MVGVVERKAENDSAGVTTVIGSYSNRSEGIWRNVSMYREDEESNVYESDPINYTLCNNNSEVIWDIRFYTQNSLGVWSRENTSQSVSRLWSTKYTTHITPTNRRLLAILAVVLLAIGIPIAAIGVVASIKRKEVR